ncbi:hypothetical protein [Streptomyces sp. G-G2]|uniref:hypothetical protein n=1 Tax=Streptomyces sp. G-G2 TaxID=3046201 RepID=UPI0024B992F4|nr:hypothetical protein [Streptomyces sp. G-G2]MDJ0380695.1 hypothetical protein [Streptomyces sp. G-G2]
MAHAAPSARARYAAELKHTSKAALALPLVLGLIYGVYAAFMKRQMGPVDAGNVFYGILCGALFAACLIALARFGPRLPREARAAAYGIFAALAMGYLYSLTDHTVLLSSGIALAVGAGVAIVAFYRYYTREP